MNSKFIKLAAFALASLLLFSAIVGCTPDIPDDTTEEESTVPVVVVPDPILIETMSQYTIIRPEFVSDDLLAEIQSFNVKMRDVYGNMAFRDDFFKESVPGYQIGEYEILLGKTNRPETREFLSGLRLNDYGYAQYGKKIVIAGHTDSGTIAAMSYFLQNVLSRDTTADGVFYKPEFDYAVRGKYSIDKLTVGDVSVSDFRIVYPEDGSDLEEYAAQLIADSISKSSGYVVDVIKDTVERDGFKHEIIIGKTNRNTDAEIAALGAGLAENQSAISVNGSDINIYGKDSSSILVAVKQFIDMIPAETVESFSLRISDRMICEYDSTLMGAMSFNVQVWGKSAERFQRVLTMCKNYLPDTIGFQEVDSEWRSFLIAGLGSQYDYVGEGRDGGTKGEYNPIFFKKSVYELIESGTRWLSDTPEKVSKYSESSLNRVYTYALLERKSDGVRVMVVNTHFDHTSNDARTKQAGALMNYINSITDYPVVLTGDFNCQSSSTAYSTIVAGPIKNSSSIAKNIITTGATYTNYGASNTVIDFVFVTPTLISVESYKVCNEKINGDFPSDHHPVYIEYRVVG